MSSVGRVGEHDHKFGVERVGVRFVSEAGCYRSVGEGCATLV